MAQSLMDSFNEWSAGVITSGLNGRAGKNTSPHGWNSVLTNVGPNSATPAKRPGLATVNASNGRAGASPVKYLTEYIATDGARHIWLLDDGTIGTVELTTGTTTSIGASTLTNPTPPTMVTAKNLLFMMDGGATPKKLRGTNLENWGITRPSTSPNPGGGAAGVMTGTFEIRVTYGNSNTGHESSAGPTAAAVSLTAQQMDLTSIPTSADAQVNQRKIYIRNVDNQTLFRLAATIANNTATTLTINVDTSTLITIGPDTTENDPPTGGGLCAWFNSYMIVAGGNQFIWSKKDQPEAFDSAQTPETVGGPDGSSLTAAYVFGDVLLLFKQRSVFVLSGTSPNTWRLQPLFEDFGAVNQQSIVAAGGYLWWWSHKGPVRWNGSGAPQLMGRLLLGDIDYDDEETEHIQSAVDPQNNLVVWTFQSSSGTRNDRMIAINYLSGAWVTDLWDPMDTRSLGTFNTTTGDYLFLGNYNGQMFRFDPDIDSDGLVSGTATGTFVAGGASITTITSSGFVTTGQGLTERYVTVAETDGEYVARRRITSNTSTVLTLASAITGLTSGRTYNFYVCGPNFEWDTIDDDSGGAFYEKRYMKVYVAVERTDSPIGVEFYLEDNDEAVKRQSFTANDVGKSTSKRRLPIAAVGDAYRVRVFNRAANEPVTLYEVAVRSELRTDKLNS